MKSLLVFSIVSASVLPGLVFAAEPPTDRPPASPRGESDPVDAKTALAVLDRVEDARDALVDLVPFSRHADARVRRRTAQVLGRLQGPAGNAILLTLILDSDARVKEMAIFSWGQLSTGSTAPLAALLDSAPNPASEVFVDLAIEATAKRTVDPMVLDLERLVSRTTFGTPAHRARALTGLALIAKRANGELPGLKLDFLDAAGRSKSADVRVAAAYLMMRLKLAPDSEVLERALRATKDADSRVRALATRALGGRKDGQALSRLVKMLDDRSESVRVASVRSLGQLEAHEAIVDFLVRAAAYSPKRRDAELVPVILAFETVVQLPVGPSLEAAAKAWANLPTLAPRSRLRGLAASCHARALLARGARDPNGLEDCRRDLPRVLFAELLARVLLVMDDAPRRAALRNLTPELRASTTASLLSLIEPPAAPDLRAWILPALSDADPVVVAEAASAAERLLAVETTDGVVAAARKWLRSTEHEVTLALLKALGALRAPKDIFEYARIATHPAVREAAVAAHAVAGHGGHGPLEMPRVVQVPSPPDDPATLPRRATLLTTLGPISLELWPEDAPRTVAAFAKRATAGFYDGLLFHRVVPDFVVQGGDPRGDGWGGPGETLRCEINNRRFERGVLGMALAGKDTGGSQFFITHSAHPHLDGGYTTFGRVLVGQDVVDALAEGDRIVSLSISPVP